MQSHGPKRVYTPQSLEFWFEKLDSEWESHFLPTQLEEGRRIYRDGEVRELELTDHDAIVHRRVDKRDEYPDRLSGGHRLAHPRERPRLSYHPNIPEGGAERGA